MTDQIKAPDIQIRSFKPVLSEDGLRVKPGSTAAHSLIPLVFYPALIHTLSDSV